MTPPAREQSRPLIPPVRVLLIGGGRMGGALVRGWLTSGLLPASNVWAIEPDSAAGGALTALGVNVRAQAHDIWATAKPDVVVYAVKPALVTALATEHAGTLAGRLAISIAAGVTLDRLHRAAPDAHWVRVMPNQPSVVNAGAAGMVAASDVSRDERDIAQALFQAVGLALWLGSEELLHVVTGLSGSGPAFVALFAEAMEDAGVRGGLPRASARALAVQTLLGAAHQLSDLNLAPSSLKEAVTSPGGTTIAGVEAAERAGLRAAVMAAVAAATGRSRELSD